MKRTTTESTYNNHTIMTNKERGLACDIKILDEIEKHIPEGPAYYDIEEYTDQTMRQIAEEIIREKALKLLQSCTENK